MIVCTIAFVFAFLLTTAGTTSSAASARPKLHFCLCWLFYFLWVRDKNLLASAHQGHSNPVTPTTTATVSGTDGDLAGNATDFVTNGNATDANATTTVTVTPTPGDEMLPEKEAQEEEQKSSLAIFFILFLIVISIILVHMLIVNEMHYVPESLAIVILGAVIGFSIWVSDYSEGLKEAEAFSANAFFLVLLPPIIFESGYNLHKGNFFANLGSILVFAIIGTTISTVVVGGGIYILGQADLVFELSAVHAFAFGAMISAVDPVATLAIFQALNVEPLLYMLVFGESVLNDAVAIVLTTAVLELNGPEMKNLSTTSAFLVSFWRFIIMFFGSALIGVAAALLSALLTKHIDLRRTPSLEFAMLLVFAYLPYGLAEGIHLSGIMAILFCGIGMSHYTHFNLSPMTQITMQQTFRTLAFVAETCVFAYLGLAIFTFPLIFKPVLIIWGIVLCLVGRAVNIFPLAWLCNLFRAHKITRKMQFVMWFSGLRGAIAFALSLFMDFGDATTRRVVIANTLAIVLFTTMVLGGGTMPLLAFLNRWFAETPAPVDAAAESRRKKRKRRKRTEQRRQRRATARATLSKTHEMSVVMDAGSYSWSDYTTEHDDQSAAHTAANQRSVSSHANQSPGPAGEADSDLSMSAMASSMVARFDISVARPFFVRKFTQKEKKESTMRLTDMALKWYEGAEQESMDDEDSEPDPLVQQPSTSHAQGNTTPSTTTTLVNIDEHPSDTDDVTGMDDSTKPLFKL